MHPTTYLVGCVIQKRLLLILGLLHNKLFHISIVSQLFIIILTYFLPTYVWVPT